jgi:hypothetical protein
LTRRLSPRHAGVFAGLLFLTLLSFPLPNRAAQGASPPPASAGAERPLWSIGDPDRDDREFALAPGGYARFAHDPFYIVGRSRPGTDWPYAQPGPLDAWAGTREHAFSVYFGLSRTALSGRCRLLLQFVDAQKQAPPTLRISVNGETWEKSVPPGNGDDSIGGHPERGKGIVLPVDFPASVLRPGVNAVRITTVRGSWVLYDRLSLTAPDGVESGPLPPFARVYSAKWEHDLLAKREDRPQQILALRAFNGGPKATFDLSVTGEKPRPVDLAPGDNALEILYPESSATRKTEIRLSSRGRPEGEPVSAMRRPCRKYAIYILPHSHMDIGYTDLQPATLRRHQEYLEQGLQLAEKTASYPKDARFKWNVESLYEIDGWLKTASPEKIAAFKKAVKDGVLGLDALYDNELTGLCRPEELVAYLDAAHRIGKAYHLPLDAAMISDVPGYTWGLVSVLAQAGVKYFSWGPNGGDHVGAAHEWDMKPFYWESPSGKEKVLVWQSATAYSPAFRNAQELKNFLIGFDRRFPRYPYDMIYTRYTTGDNAPPDPHLSDFVRDWNDRYAWPHLAISTTRRMFRDFDARYGKKLPAFRGDYTGYWEDGAASSALETSINRNAAESIAQDEILWSMLRPAAYPNTRFEDAWKNALLYDEHTWGAYNSWSNPDSDFVKRQWAIKRQFALDARDQARALRKDAFKAVAPAGDSETFAVFNVNSWPRNDLVTLPPEVSRGGDVVRDRKGREVPSQRLSDGSLAFLTGAIPPLSSKTFAVAPGKPAFRGSASADENGLRNDRLTLTFDPKTGAIAGLKARGIDDDLVDVRSGASRGLNDYLYVPGPSNETIRYASNAKIAVLDRGPLVASVRIDSDAPGGRSLSRVVRVIDGMDEVRITDTLDKLPVRSDEAVHVGFGFNLPGAVARLDLPWAVMRPDFDQIPFANKSVYPVNRWADLSNGRYGVTCATRDAPMLQVGGITAPRENWDDWRKAAKTGSALYWNLMNNYWHTNYRADQSGRSPSDSRCKSTGSSIRRRPIDLASIEANPSSSRRRRRISRTFGSR